MPSILEDLQSVFELGRFIPRELFPFLLAVAFWLFAIRWDIKRHLLCQIEAAHQLKHLKRFNSPQEKITQLRSVNPYVFEK